MGEAAKIKKKVSTLTADEILEKISKELQRHGIRAEISLDPLSGRHDLYIGEEDADKLDRLCDEDRLSAEARRLLC